MDFDFLNIPKSLKVSEIYLHAEFFFPHRRAERKETARLAVLAKEPDCRVGRGAADVFPIQFNIWPEF
jgi:hypothetical protein